jgi:hypothetical protein
VLLDEIETLRTEATGVEVELASETQSVARAVTLRVGSAAAAVAIAGTVLAGILVGFLFGGSSSGSEMIYGRVGVTSGTPPVAAGAPCTFFVHSAGDDDDSWDAQVEVVCNGSTLYGGDGSGFLDCDWSGDIAETCRDDDFTADGGDPKLTFDRSAWRTLIQEQRPQYQVQIELDPVRAH